MRKIVVIMSCILISLLLMSIGFGSWQESLHMKGSIDVKKPKPPKVKKEIVIEVKEPN